VTTVRPTNSRNKGHCWGLLKLARLQRSCQTATCMQNHTNQYGFCMTDDAVQCVQCLRHKLYRWNPSVQQLPAAAAAGSGVRAVTDILLHLLPLPQCLLACKPHSCMFMFMCHAC
jgi:hypothetical protein